MRVRHDHATQAPNNKQELDWRRALWICVTLVLGACFGGEFVQGLPCDSDADCGPTLSCIDGLCDGLGDPGLCGNGLRDVGEACDDGNLAEGDECTPMCRLPVCGDRFLAPDEECDDGNTLPRDGCDPMCRTSGVCGNGQTEPDEECDDGNTDDGDGCAADCRLSVVCGNGITQPGEECDDGNTDAGDACTPVCLLPVCGDGFMAPGEACDDGNEVGTDGCTPTCALPACGDGFVTEGEACDDGNEVETDDCTTLCTLSPQTPVLELSYSQVKQFDFTWEPVLGAEYYQLLERVEAGAELEVVAEEIVGESHSLTVPLYSRVNASYQLRACNALRCVESEVVDVVGSLAEAVGYFKASNTGSGDEFGGSVALSGDGNTLAVGALGENSSATGIDGPQDDDSAYRAGAVYVFVHDGAGGWSQQAYVKASNTDDCGEFDDCGGLFGWSVALSGDGNTLAVGALRENSSATGIDGPQDDDSAEDAGAVYVFVREGEAWSQQAYVKASNTGSDDYFGWSVALSGDGNTLAVGAREEDSNATGIDGPQDDDSAEDAGAVYVFVREGEAWSQRAYVKASNTGSGDRFGGSVALSGDGNTLAVGAYREDSSATGIDGLQDDDSTPNAGAVYVFVREGDGWSQQAYVKSSNTGSEDFFGWSVALSADGNTLAVGALGERSSATGIDGLQDDDSVSDAGAAYVFVREGEAWSQQAYVKASNTGSGDYFGWSVALSGDGNTLAVGADGEESSATGIDGPQDDDSTPDAGAVYVFARADETWSQQAYVKASHTAGGDRFDYSVSLSNDGHTLAAGSPGENRYALGVGNEPDPSIPAWDSGAVFLY